LYLLDEPTTGLHVADIDRLLAVLNSLVDRGHTVLIIEHNMDVAKTADHVIDLGPGGGESGGRVVVAGTPEHVAKSKRSETAPYLAKALAASQTVPRDELYRQDRPEKQEAPSPEPPPETLDAPWEADGRKWHLEQVTLRDGSRPSWPPETLEALIDIISKLPGADEPDYASPDRIVFTAQGRKDRFAHVRTNDEWVLTLLIRTPKALFDSDDLAAKIDLPRWNDLKDVHVYGRKPRVRVYTAARHHDNVGVMLHHKKDVTGREFRRMLEKAWAGYMKMEGGS
jgi:ABC-type glutathione transport system ATPase component